MKKFTHQWIDTAIKELGFSSYTNIQNLSIPIIQKNKNTIIVSPTGSGKTYCFLLPILDKIDFSTSNLQAIIISPTRELARQLYSKFIFFKAFNSNLRVKLLVGGVDLNNEIKKINKNNFQILISTPDRFIEVNKLSKLNLKNTKFLVFDEADMLIDLGFKQIFDTLIELLKFNNQLLKIATSATMHEKLSNQFRKNFKNAVIVDENNDIWKNKNIKHYLIHYDDNDKLDVLNNFLKIKNPYLCFIFANKQSEVELIYKFLLNQNYNVGFIHGKLDSRTRKNTFKDIYNLKYQYVVATDLVSRGIDIDGIDCVISWNLPKDDIWYIHRSGRTGRNNKFGISYVFFNKEDFVAVNRLYSKNIIWNNIKFKNNTFVEFNYKFRTIKFKKDPEVDKKINFVVQTTLNQKIKPNYKKKMKLKIKKIKQKEKRKKIDAAMKKILIKKYKQQNKQS